MALLAGDRDMPATQRIARPVVIEVCPIDRLERRGLVAAAARGPQFALVDVGVTAAALTMLERLVPWNRPSAYVPGEHEAQRLMTSRTAHGVVRAGQRVVGLGVIKSGSGLPVLRVVTLDAILRERAAMRVLVAGGASPLQPEPARIGSWPLREAHDRRDPECRLVTARALLTAMTPVEWPTRARVIETLRRTAQPIPADEREVHASVVGMTARAALRLYGG